MSLGQVQICLANCVTWLNFLQHNSVPSVTVVGKWRTFRHILSNINSSLGLVCFHGLPCS